jgi:hypothetical protein
LLSQGKREQRVGFVGKLICIDLRQENYDYFFVYAKVGVAVS